MSHSDLKESLEREKQALLQARDELKVQLHLGGLEAKEQWDALEKKWAQVSAELGRIGDQAKGPIDEIGKASRGLFEEIKSGYSRVRDQLKG